MAISTMTRIYVSCDNEACKEKLQVNDCGTNIAKALNKARGQKGWLVKVKEGTHYCPTCRDAFEGKRGRKKIDLESLPPETREDLEAEDYFAKAV